ncbi:response regulator [Flavobacterium ardleyense]|uniref:histidine kinase n=1 Tax=Flavobacterium ardleyense TaxID=2038737 RepID=A0ABW5Z4C0_9FLAO
MNFSKHTALFILFFSGFQLAWAQQNSAVEKEAKILLSKGGESFLALDGKRSLNYAKQSLELSLRNDDDLLAAKAYNLIGLNFDEFAEYSKSIEYYDKGIVAALKTDNDTIKCWLYNNLANVYCYRKIDFKKGIENYKKGVIYAKRLKDQYEITFSTLNIGSAYFTVGDYDTGIKYVNQVRDYIENDDDIESKISLNSNLALYYNHLNDYEKAEEHYLKALSYADQGDVEYIKSHISVVYEDFSNFYLKYKDFEKAHKYLAKHNELRDEIYNDDKLKGVKVAGLELEHDEINRRIEVIEAEKLAHEQRIEKNKQFVVLSAIIVTTLLLLLFSFIRNNRLKTLVNAKLKKANADLLFAKEKAEEASKIKSQFISTVSHELRTPLYGVVGITDIILDEHQELKDSPHLKSLKFSAKYLLSLVNDILNVYKIEENQVVLDNIVFNLHDELETIKDSLHFIAIKNNNKIFLEFDSTIPEAIISDKVRLSQIFINLISNALKFTTNGHVTIKANLVKTQGTLCQIRFEIIDNGIGIAKKDQDKVFDKFVQIVRKEDDYLGTGLGLTIVKKMVELFNGTIELESEENVGTKISLVIPFETDQFKISEIIKNIIVDESTRRDYTVLVVEDNKINQLVTRKLLENNHFICDIVDNGYTALELLEEKSYDVILMDINMPKINGFETSKLIREKGIKTPIIAVTAFDKQEIMDKIKDAKIDDVIVKPFDSGKLFDVIKKFVDK